MRANRQADLQRKLTLTAVPTPPAGLADRIKTDIPKHFPDSSAERRRLGNAVAFNMRVAASILLLVGSLFVALHLLNKAAQDDDRRLGEFSRALEKNAPPSQAVSPVPKLQGAPQVVTSTEEAPSTVAPPALKAGKPAVQVAEAKTKGEAPEADTNALRYREKDEAANGPGQAAGALDKKQRDDVGRAAPASAAAAPRPMAPPPVPAVADQTKVAGALATASTESRVDGLRATQPADAAPPQTANELARKSAATASYSGGTVQRGGFASGTRAHAFGYDLERTQLDRVTPLVQHFAAPVERPEHGVRLEADAAPAPLDPSKGVLRISIDTASGRPGSAPSQVAANARLEIVINGNAVESQRAVTGSPSSFEPSLMDGVSMTAVYEFQLLPSVSGGTHLATVRLRYLSPDGSEHSLERNLRVSDIASSWNAAPERTKRSSLAAAFGEIRARGGDTAAIAGKARAIGLDELADLGVQH